MLGFVVIIQGCATTSTTKAGLRVQSLGVEEGVQKYYAENVEIVSFAPGSGWVKVKTREGISPIISLGNVTVQDIEMFNRFSKGSGLPIRAKLSGNALNILLAQDEVAYLVSRKNESETSLRMVSERIQWQPDHHPRLAIHRGKDGSVSLMEAGSTYLAKR